MGEQRLVDLIAALATGAVGSVALAREDISDTLPGVAILLLSAGMIQRDGVTVLGGYLFLGLTAIYFAALAYAAFWAGQGISSSIGG